MLVSKLKALNEEQSGVTIVELMIVIAVAALIIVLVLVAAPALQRNARNTQRRNDIGAIRGQLTTVANNNNNDYPELSTFSGDVLAQIDQAIYQSGNSTATVVGAASCVDSAGTPASVPLSDTNADSIIDATDCTALAMASPYTAPGVFTAATSTPSLPTTTGENQIYYIADRKLNGTSATASAAIDTDIVSYVLPGPDELHIIVGVACEQNVLTNGTSNIDQSGSAYQYTANDLKPSTLKVAAFIYQLEGETAARCEDNA